MNYREEQKDLFSVPEGTYLAHCISADLGMGAGIAVQFNHRYNMKQKLSVFGNAIMSYWNNGQHGFCVLKDNTFNLITKKHYWEKPTYETLTAALEKMKVIALKEDIKTIAMPLIGCGIDKLSWDRVSEILKDVFKDTEIDILVCRQDLPVIRVLAVGSRTFDNYDLFCKIMDAELAEFEGKYCIEIVSGGAHGADAFAERYAKERGYRLTVFPADWNQFGKRAGYIRNEETHEYIAKVPTRKVIAFWDGESKGTKHSFSLARLLKNPIKVYHYEEHRFLDLSKLKEEKKRPTLGM